MKAEDYYIGIDIGTSNSCSGLFLNGKVKIIPNKMGERITPSVVLLQNNQKYYVGEEALCESVGSDNNFISEIKRFIGLSYDEFIELGFDKSINYIHLIKNINGLPTIEIENNGEKSHFTAEDITYMIIKKMIKSTEDFIAEIKEGTKLTSAILTVPAQFTDNQKNAVFNAAKRAGLEIPRIINEPTAAALAYGFGHNLISKLNRKDKLINSSIRGDEYELSFSSNKYVGEKDQKKKLMIFDLGGGTFDISILNLKINQSTSDFEVLLTDGDIHLGGSDFDQALIDYCVETFCERMMINKHDLLRDFNAMRKLKIKCEKDKKMLSIKNSVNITIENFYDNKDLTINIKQKEFIDICKDKYEKIKEKIYSVLSELDITKDDIDNVILVGGGSKIHGIKELLIELFGENKIRDDINPEEAVAIGATLYAVKTQGNQKMNFNLQDIIPFNIGIGVKNQDKEEAKYGDKMHVIIPKYTKFPGETYQKKYEVNLTERHPDIIVNVFEGNNKYVNNNTKIGKFNKKNLNRKGAFQYTLSFNIDINGKLNGKLICDSLGLEENYVSLNQISQAKAVDKTMKISKNNRLKTVASTILSINEKLDIIKNSQAQSIIIKNLEDCAYMYEDLIENYKSFVKYNENLYEKLFAYTKELFNIYLKLIENKGKIESINLNMSKQVIDPEITEIIEKIKGKMKYLIKELDYVEDLLNIFIVLRDEFKNEFYQIFANYIELLNNKGIELQNGRFSRYYIKLYFEKVYFNSKKYVNEKDLYVINKDIYESYKKQIKIADEGLVKINSFVHYVETIIKEGKFIPGNTGYTWIDNKLKKLEENPKKEDILDILDLFHNMLDSFEKKDKSIERAYCLGNIIKINYEHLNVREYEKLEKYIDKFEAIMKGKGESELPGYNEIMEIINKIVI